VGAHPLLALSDGEVKNPIKLLYDPDQPDGRLTLTASAFDQLGQGLLLRRTLRFLP